MKDNIKKDIARLRSDVRKLAQQNKEKVPIQKLANPFTGGVTGNYWTQTGMPWVGDDSRKAVLTEWFWRMACPLRE
jgi:hypothetical protein